MSLCEFFQKRWMRSSDRISISWGVAASRSELLASAIGAKVFTLSYFRTRSLARIIATYFLGAVHTVYILFKERPSVVLMINQPVFLPMVVYLYAKIQHCSYVIDSHSGIFNKTIWRIFIPLMKFVYRSCFVNIAHNKHDAQIYESWGVSTIIIATECYPTDCCRSAVLATKNNIVVIGVFAADEPTAEVVLAARKLPGVTFYITGPIESAKRVDIRRRPKNVVFTGFLPRDDFLGLVKACDGAMVLVKTDKTMQRGAWEALSCETPLILSNWKILRETFPRGAVYVDNSTSGIVAGVCAFFDERKALKRDILELKQEKADSWKTEIAILRGMLNGLS